MKGLILCAGKGTRLQPYSFTQPKTLLPVVNKPVLQYCIENLVKSGIQDIGVVIHPTQEVIPAFLGNGEQFGCHVEYIVQTEQKGISHAVKQAESFIGKEPFILLLGDNLIGEGLQILIDSYHQHKSNGSILLAQVKNPQDYGIAEIKGDQIIALEEKPKQPKSDLAVIGAYLFDEHIFKAIHSIAPSARGEYEITDAISWLIEQQYSISYTITEKLYSDVGTIDRWLEANQWMMQRDLDQQIIVGKGTIVENCTFLGPVIIGDDCVLRNAEIGPYVAIHDGVQLDHCMLQKSILLDQANLSHLSTPISNSVFGREVKLEGKQKGKVKAMHFYLGDKSKVYFDVDADD